MVDVVQKLYTKLWCFEKGQKFKQAPLEVGWKYTKKRNAVGMVTFSSTQLIPKYTHIKLTGNFPEIGAFIVKIEQTHSDINNYIAVDYKHYLMGEINYTSKKKAKTHQILAAIKKNAPELTWKIGKTSYTHKDKLVWKKKTIFRIIQELIWLEWKYAKKLVYFDVDSNKNLSFKYYPTTIEGYSFKQAHKYTNSIDYTQMSTGWKVVDSSGKLVAQYSNKDLTAKYGHIYTIITSEDEDEDKKTK